MKTQLGRYELFGEPKIDVLLIENDMVTWKFINERRERQTSEENFRNGIARHYHFVKAL